jgi:hypothetical protein
MAGSLIWTTAGDMRNLKPLEPSVEITVALARIRLIGHTIASEIPCRPRKIARASCTSSSSASAAGRGSVCATGHCFDAIFRSELTEGAGTRRVLQPSALCECR